MLFKKKEKERELTSQLVNVRKFIIFSDQAIVSIDSIRCIERNKNNVIINYRANAKTEATTITCANDKVAKEMMDELGTMLNQEAVILGKE